MCVLIFADYWFAYMCESVSVSQQMFDIVLVSQKNTAKVELMPLCVTRTHTATSGTGFTQICIYIHSDTTRHTYVMPLIYLVLWTHVFRILQGISTTQKHKHLNVNVHSEIILDRIHFKPKARSERIWTFALFKHTHTHNYFQLHIRP